MSVASGALAAAAVEPHLRGRFGMPFLWEPECESTQALLLDSDLPEGAVAATDHQTSGRGRLGHRWEAPPRSSVLASVVLHPPAERHWPELSLLGGAAAAIAIEDATGLSAQLKWPNDVMLDRRKVGGVIAEARGAAVVLGIGINVRQSRDELPAGTQTPPGSLRTITGQEHDPASLLGSVLLHLERLYDAWRGDGLAAVYTEIGSRNFLFGRRVTVDGRPGTAAVIGHDGRLEVHLEDGEAVHVESGTVDVVR
ncbi:MAG TPA: biotin--[acetyl-CoA-carboxylase] ligase [Gaiella sp.]|jgi:BirA family biotin operon repressor/biotin-[acetyl-CoA-carboxylase] ligase